jgi:hypothetical protein
MNWQNFVTALEVADEVPNEYLWERIRNWRNNELLLCDWTQIDDATADKTAWLTYRTALRDLPKQNADPKKVKFPVAPNETPAD